MKNIKGCITALLCALAAATAVSGAVFISQSDFSAAAEITNCEAVERQVNRAEIATSSAVTLPFYQDCGTVGGSWQSLYGEIYTVNNKWTADSSHKWGALVDFGTESYAFSAFVNAKNAGGGAGTFGFLLHASEGTDGMNGMLVGLQLKNNTVVVSAGWLNNGVYTYLLEHATDFKGSYDYHVKLISDGSFIELMINGYRILTLSDHYYTGGKFAILNGGGEITYSKMTCVAFADNIADCVYRPDWGNAGGADTFAMGVSFSSAFNIRFGLPDDNSAKNFRLVRRTSFSNGAQRAEVSAGGTSYGTWSVAADNNYCGDTVFPLSGFTSTETEVEFTVTPQDTFSVTYMWLIYESGGTDYIADSVYLAYAADAAAHGVQIGSPTVEHQFMPISHNMLLTARAGEKVVWARQISAVSKMQAKTYSDSSVSSSVSLPYRIYLPEGYDGSREYPVMLFLHGAGERGNDNTSQVATNNSGTDLLIKRFILGDKGNDFIVIAPQCPADRRWVERDWTPGSYSLDGTPQSIPSQLLTSLLYNDIFKNYSIDRSRVYGAGISMGGFGIMDLAMRHPDLFAAVLNCSGGADPTKADLFSTTAIRGYHSPSDTTVNYNALKTLISSMRSKGMDAEFSEVANAGHFSWQVGFEDGDLIEWFLSHKKSWTVDTVLNGGTLPTAIPSTYNYNDGQTVLPTPAKTGSRFGGWYLNKDFEGEAVTSFSGKTARNLTLYAKWVRDITVKVVSDGETLFTKQIASGEIIDLSTYTAEKPKNTLIGWTDGTHTYSVNSKVRVNNDVTFTAIWDPETYIINVYRGGELIFNETLEYGEEINFTVPEEEGFVFAGLFADEEMTQSAQMPLTATGNLTLYIKYELEIADNPDTPDNPDNPDKPDDTEKPPVTPAETPKGGCGSVANSGNEIIFMLSACFMLLLTATAVRAIRKKSK